MTDSPCTQLASFIMLDKRLSWEPLILFINQSGVDCLMKQFKNLTDSLLEVHCLKTSEAIATKLVVKHHVRCFNA